MRITPGDICCVRLPLLGDLTWPYIEHHDVCVDYDARDKPRFVHKTRQAGVVYATVEEFARGRTIFHRPPRGPRNEIVARMRAQVGESDYRLLSRNCEHAVALAETGRPESLQVERGMWLAAVSAVALAMVNQNAVRVDSNGYRRDRRGRFATRLVF